jgi:hypothetical protein
VPEHTCVHHLVAQSGQNLYYQCRCGSRRHGVANYAKRHVPVDRSWLAGEKDNPS